MPNYCYNELTVKGEPVNLARFVDKMMLGKEGKAFSFAPFVTPPDSVLRGVNGYGFFVRQDGTWTPADERLKEAAEAQGMDYYHGAYAMDADGVIYTQPEMGERGLVDWYTWNNKNWGTKWDACDVYTSMEPGELTVTFLTAWAPPVPVVLAMQAQHPELNITLFYEEPGVLLRGTIDAYGNDVEEEWPDSDEEEGEE